MKIPAYRYRCPLGCLDDRDDPEDIKRQGWREQRILVVSEKDTRLDFVERELIRRIGERLYGEKRHG